MLSMTVLSSMQAITFIGPPQLAQASMSILKTRLSRCAQVIADRCLVAVFSSTSSEALAFCPLPRFAGVTWIRCQLLGANTP